MFTNLLKKVPGLDLSILFRRSRRILKVILSSQLSEPVIVRITTSMWRRTHGGISGGTGDSRTLIIQRRRVFLLVKFKYKLLNSYDFHQNLTSILNKVLGVVAIRIISSINAQKSVSTTPKSPH